MGGPDERRSKRTNVLLKGDLEWENFSSPIRVANLSSHGALLIGENFPPAETIVRVRIRDHSLSGWIMWVSQDRAGIQFERAVAPELFAHRPNTSGMIVQRDDRAADYRRPGFRGNQMTDEQRKIVDDWKRGQDPSKREN